MTVNAAIDAATRPVTTYAVSRNRGSGFHGAGAATTSAQATPASRIIRSNWRLVAADRARSRTLAARVTRGPRTAPRPVWSTATGWLTTRAAST